MEYGATTAFLRIEEIWRHHKLRVDPVNPEHEATGRVPWVKLDKLYKHFTFRSGASTLESYEIKFIRYEDI
jgi:hypothetical protein